jgi:hypothetical protein
MALGWTLTGTLSIACPNFKNEASAILIKILISEFWVILAKSRRFDCNQTRQEQARIGQGLRNQDSQVHKLSGEMSTSEDARSK